MIVVNFDAITYNYQFNSFDIAELATCIVSLDIQPSLKSKEICNRKINLQEEKELKLCLIDIIYHLHLN